MKITDISLQAKNKDRVNVSVDGTYAFSLDVYQVGELGVRVGR
ncbi:TPA: recombination regulator RecX, partial [Candidatus Saccharibacteria bacterium]|nr:recombination regulator RecX [Candidatus Saccharibacteria bacterium]